jgi:hypothetical protein
MTFIGLRDNLKGNQVRHEKKLPICLLSSALSVVLTLLPPFFGGISAAGRRMQKDGLTKRRTDCRLMECFGRMPLVC